MDYIKSMTEEKSKFSFPEMYEGAILKKQIDYEMNDELSKALIDKRKFGLQKYGEFSFQSNLESCMTSPTLLHAQEEMIDALNYLLHEQYKNDLRGIDNEKLKQITNVVIEVYNNLEYLKRI